jgi:hypothetical protein
MTNKSNNGLHIATTPSIIDPGEVSILRSAPTIFTNGLSSSHTQPTYDLDFSQFLSPEPNGRWYDFNRVLTSDLVADIIPTTLDLEQDSAFSPVGAWLSEYYLPGPTPQAALKQEVVINEEKVVKEDVASVATVMTRMESIELIQSSDEKNSVSNAIHSCPQCDRKFTRRFNMLTHMKTHDKSRYV